jgi:hypothetical protein
MQQAMQQALQKAIQKAIQKAMQQAMQQAIVKFHRKRSSYAYGNKRAICFRNSFDWAVLPPHYGKPVKKVESVAISLGRVTSCDA